MSISPTQHTPHHLPERGTIASGAQGPGTFAATASRDGATETADITRTYANGRTVSDVVTISRGKDGGFSGTVSQDGGPAAQFTATRTKTGSGSDISAVLTNRAGAQETLDASINTEGPDPTATITGTTFNGSKLASTYTAG